MNIDVTTAPAQNITVQQESSIQLELLSQQILFETQNGLPQQNLFVGPIKPTFSGAGMWIQTGLGKNGTDFEVWIEDGT